AMRDRFQTAVADIGRVWDGIKRAVAARITSVLRAVISRGLIAGCNRSIADHVPGVSTLDRIAVPQALKNASRGYATGGWTGPGARLTPAGIVHADEYVVRKASRGSFERENPGLLDHINRHGTMAGYAKGGMVRPVKGGRVTSGFGAGRGRY